MALRPVAVFSEFKFGLVFGGVRRLSIGGPIAELCDLRDGSGLFLLCRSLIPLHTPVCYCGLFVDVSVSYVIEYFIEVVDLLPLHSNQQCMTWFPRQAYSRVAEFILSHFVEREDLFI